MRWTANRRVAWIGMTLGGVLGALMGLWSFDGPVPVPERLGAYGETSRRLARLGHVSLFGLGILNLLLVRELDGLALGDAARRLAAGAMSFGNVALPLTLFAAAAWHPAKYLMGPPALAVCLALALAARGARSGDG
jgi:hypothetical protein